MAIADDFDPLTVPAVMPVTVRRTNEQGFPRQALLDYEQALQGWMRNNVVATNARFAEVSDSLAGVSAAVTTEANARVAADEALAEQITTVEAAVDGFTASGELYFAAKATPAGAASAFGLYLTAGSSFAGLEAMALSGGGSAIGLAANQLKFTDPGTATDVLTYSGGKFRFTGDVAIDGNLAVSGSFTADAVASGFSAIDSTAGTAALAGTVSWADLGPPITLTVTPDGGNGYPLLFIRDNATAENLTAFAGNASVRYRIMLNGSNIYEREIFNLAIPSGGTRGDGITDFYNATSAGASHTFQLQYSCAYAPGISGDLFAKIMVLMISR
ncbi:hypothetical protein [Bosea psychrotolerans]|uniref:Uncharacterized protein n=1 Tax=Bosea psychrotolerans TaxID=1871628 RepID=A0A2S4MCC3_9HYPH|nr:hypothetical protein [Bosea psychrotolerans]POR52398.1 hypothetical protein CYD53_10563 [Bosea psychrotolerans]